MKNMRSWNLLTSIYNRYIHPIFGVKSLKVRSLIFIVSIERNFASGEFRGRFRVL